MKKFKLITLLPFLMLSTLTTGCSKYSFKPTKIAVFADNQITQTVTGGNTAFSIAYLKQHLALCKQNNVDVIVIPGDLVNNSIESYYQKFEECLEEAYGKDSSKYPEFVYSMGNHEWYTSTEATSPNAVSLFKKHARIKTKNLKRESDSTVPGQTGSVNAANYYKVINGIPFIGLSFSNSSGLLSPDAEDELRGWLKEINKLPSVKAGGPIFIASHYAIKDVSYTHGQGSSNLSIDLDNVLKNYPQAVVFTGDTHFAGANERTINQVDYTTINLGSSSYSRHVSRSGTMKEYESYYNVGSSGVGSKDIVTGDVATDFNKTPHIHFVEVGKNGDTKYNRYFSTQDRLAPIHLGLEWTIPAKVKKETFIYTNNRFKDPEWAKKMYNATGLRWEESAKAQKAIVNNNLVVSFPDVIDFNWCEHYKIKVTGSTTKDYDFVSHYYKWEDTPHQYSFTINNEDLPGGTDFEIEIEAYDHLDNKSLNSLKA